MRTQFSALAFVLAFLPAFAIAAGGGNAAAEGVNYIAINPPLIVNYGGPGKMRFIKAELSLRAENAEDATKVTHHLPLIRDRLVSILSTQTEEVISTAEGKEYLRVYALSEINKALLKVEGLDEEGGEKTATNSEKEKSKDKDAAQKKAVADAKAPNAGEPAAKPASSSANVASEAPVAQEPTGAQKADQTTLPDINDIHIVKGPASDLFFNNFVVQK